MKQCQNDVLSILTDQLVFIFKIRQATFRFPEFSLCRAA